MSTDKQVYPLYYEAKNDKVRKRLGIKGGFYWTEAKKLSIAISRGAVAIDDAGYDEDDFKKPVRVNFPVVNDLPPEGVFDTEFCNRYEKGGEDGITMMAISFNDNINGEDATTAGDDNDDPDGTIPDDVEKSESPDSDDDCSECEIPVATLSLTHRFLHLFFFSKDEDGKYRHHATPEQRNNVIRMEMDTEDSYLQSLLTAVRAAHHELDKLTNYHLSRLAESVGKAFPHSANHRISPAEFDKFISTWMKTDYLDQGLLTKEWQNGNYVSGITRTPSGANAGGGNITDRGEGFKHDKTSLARDVATGVLARSMDVDIYNLHPAHAKRVEEIIAENKPPFSVFRDKFITMPGGLDYSRAIVVASVKEAPIGIEVIPAHVTEYLNKVLIETDHANPDPEIVDIACGRSSAPMPQRVTEEGKHDGEEKPQPSCAMADKQATAETVEPDATEHHQDTQPLDAQSQVNSVDAKYQKLRAELHEARKTIPPKNPVDADKLLAASRGEFVEGISDPNDPKWIKGIQTRDSVYQNQPETEQNDQKAEQNSPNTQQNEPETKQPEPVVQQEPEKICTACGQRSGGNCPDCGAVMGDATYQETFDEENQVEAKENDPEEMEGAEHPHNENAGSDPHRDCSDETGEVADPVIVEDIEPGIYYGISNENYHVGPGVSKSQLDDIADTPALYLWRKNAPVDNTKTKTLDLGTAFHFRVLEPEEFSNRFIVAPEFNRRTNAGKEEEKAFLMECASTGKTVITAEEGRKIELMYQSVMALPLGQWLVESAGHAESSIYWEDPETGILCRCRPDKIIPEFHWIMDVKTTADIQRFKTAYYDYRYHVQDAFYSDGYEAQFGVQPTFVFLVASTTIECGRYPVEIFMMGEEAKLAGQLEYHRNLRTLADCLNTNEWPAIKTLSLPRWAKEYAND
ncbi:TPA: exodeoxyribonuclease VIII [Escherichia coli]|uniref:exodeoxyribonuclease VIII n=4 Tax=Escherichia coli TaxID=562 RepID=UPI0002512A62|nr:exodeoxyribonuclease VIII [Escherichia coli]EES2746035.1 exodeoxyribonuclease VIII [Escherichia coli O157]EEW3507620.1 exodeoxyribonuclease VIII [Escherichia coli O156:H25]EHW29226.1 enterobacterial exodeoxyribonuclease VIII family protein [Escherichia coli DEC8E]HDQ6750795.1 exodeoxyribonuclease VIII [Escherichia coli O76:H7]EEC9499392.1 exodeoxyribonuclease VIII [Escherichia coli]